MSTTTTPQASLTGYASRVRFDQTSILVSMQPVTRTNKRSSMAMNYAEVEDDFDEDDDDNTNGTNTPGFPRRDPLQQEVKRPIYQPTQHPAYTENRLHVLAEEEEVLIPVRINIDNLLGQDSVPRRYTDFFMWNLNEKVLTPDTFGAITCQDLDLPIGHSASIAMQIRQAIADYKDMATFKLPTDSGLKVVMHLSVNLDKQLYEDRFEWDLAGDELTPERFAKQVVKDMGISGEFYPAVAHALHENILKMKREVVEGHFAEFENLAPAGKGAGWRIDQDGLGEDWAPTLETLSPEEIEKREIERDRAIRRMKRESARMDINDPYSRKKQRARYRYDDSPSRGASPW